MDFGWSLCSPITFNKQNSSVWAIQNAHTQALCGLVNIILQYEEFKTFVLRIFRPDSIFKKQSTGQRIRATQTARIIFCCLLVRTAAESAPEMGNPLIRGKTWH